MKLARSDSIHTTASAISSAVPSRFIGTLVISAS